MKCKKLTVLFLSLLTVCAASPMFPASALDVAPPASDPIPVAPGWVPQTAEDAVMFLNQYGNTHVADGMICVVLPIPQKTECESPQFNGSMKTWLVQDKCCKYTPVTEEPALPEVQNDETMKEYWKKQRAYEEYKQILEVYGDWYFKAADMYRVVVVMPESVGDLDIVLTHEVDVSDDPTAKDPSGEQLVSRKTTVTYSFASDAGHVWETDYFAWLPDCYTEYRTYQNEHGTVSVHQGEKADQIVLCLESNGSTGQRLFSGQAGVSCKGLMHSIIKEQELLPIPKAGGGFYAIEVYEPTTEGRVEFNIFSGWLWRSAEANRLVRKAYTVQKDGTRLVADEASSVECDLNGDGLLTAADVILLEKHLTTEEKLSDVQYFIADINGDMNVNALDLTLLKRRILTNDIRYINTEPVQFDPDEPIVIDDPKPPVVSE
ncbi:MAG: dockerin type I repeat-containing protein [Oscillospiraceae bacterium]|nr:dockerin type I repeat-containing protein [Oscillospiraceae bacterium]